VETTSIAITIAIATAMVMEGPPMVVEDPMMEDPMMEDPLMEDPMMEDPMMEDPTTTVSRHDEEAPERTMPNGIARVTAARDGMIISKTNASSGEN
jgi:hypothetical protein